MRLISWCSVIAAACHAAAYTERLDVRALPSGGWLVEFGWGLTGDGGAAMSHGAGGTVDAFVSANLSAVAPDPASAVFPVDVARAVRALGVRQLAVVLTAGGWRRSWGPVPAQLDVPAGSSVDVTWEGDAGTGTSSTAAPIAANESAGAPRRSSLRRSPARRWRMLLRWASGLTCHSLATGLSADDDVAADAAIASGGLAGERGPGAAVEGGRGGTKRGWYTLARPAAPGAFGRAAVLARHTLVVPGGSGGGFCTESLHTAVTRLLPCRRRAGLAAAALHPRAVAAAPFRVLSLRVSPAAGPGRGGSEQQQQQRRPWALSLTLAFVVSPPPPPQSTSAVGPPHAVADPSPAPLLRLDDVLRGRTRGVAVGDRGAGRAHGGGEVEADSEDDENGDGECPAVGRGGGAIVRVFDAAGSSGDGISGNGAASGRVVPFCRLRDVTLFQADAAALTPWQRQAVAGDAVAACVAVRRSLRERSLGVGALVVAIEHSCPGACGLGGGDGVDGDAGGPLAARLTQVLPWFLQPTGDGYHVWRHAAGGAADDVDVTGGGAVGVNMSTDSEVESERRGTGAIVTAVRRATVRGAPAVDAVDLSLPPCTVTYVRLDFTLPLLHAEDCPPDTHRGLDVPSAALAVWRPAGPGGAPRVAAAADWPFALARTPDGDSDGAAPAATLFTPACAVEPPSPDFSMPFNVVTLVMTVFAFVAGSMLNVLGRKRKAAPVAPTAMALAA